MTDEDRPETPFSAAVLAAVDGRADELAQRLDERPALVSETSGPPFDATLLHYAAAANGVEDELQRTPKNAPEIVRLLLGRGADPDALSSGYGGGPNSTPMCLLVSSWHPFKAGVQGELVRALIEGGARPEGRDGDGMPLTTALVFGYTGAARALVESGAKADCVFYAAGLGDLDAVRTYFDDDGHPLAGAKGRFVSPWPETCPSTDSEIVQAAFHFAVTHGHTDVAAFLIERGADVNGETRGQHKETPLEQARFVHREAMVEWLLARGAVDSNPDARAGA